MNPEECADCKCKAQAQADDTAGEFNKELIPVCKVVFMNTLGYKNDKFITVALTGAVAESVHGKHDHSYHSLTEEDDKFMEEHMSFQPGISHYLREHAPIVCMLTLDPECY